MEFTEFALRLMLVFFPGIICFYIVEALTVHRERPTHEVFLRCFVYGIVCYLVYGFLLVPLNIPWVEHATTIDFPNEVSIESFLSDSKARLDIGEISWVSGVAVVVGLVFSFAIAHKWPNDFGQRSGISLKFGDANVWSRTFNSKETQWATVRDIERELMFSGYVEAFSDVEDVAELLLGQVEVYNEKTGAKLYEADHLYLSRRKEDLTVEIPNPPVEVASVTPTGIAGLIKRSKRAWSNCWNRIKGAT